MKSSFFCFRFMEDMEERKCQIQLYVDEACSSKPELDANTYLFKDQVVIKSPQLFRNRSQPNVEPFTSIEYQLCTPQKILNPVDGVLKTQSCINVGRDFQIPSPTRDCKNVLRRLTYEIHHQGLKGVTKIYANIELVDLKNSGPEFFRKSGDILTLSQEFGYTHFWTTDGTREKIQRSGNPGYFMGKPLLTGVLGIKKVITGSQDKDEVVHYIKEDPLYQAMTVLVPTGLCEDPKLTRRQRILFGVDSFSGCSFRMKRSDLSKDCEEIKDKILHLLLGSPTHKGINEVENLRVASFGNSDPNKPGDWIKVQITRPPRDHIKDNVNSTTSGSSESQNPPGTCKDVVKSLHIEVAYAFIGSTANPQAKILGVNYRFGRRQDVKFRCVGLGSCRSVEKTQNIDVSTSVSFVDVTKPALRYYAEYPVLTIRLPYDFFYPFVSLGGRRSHSSALFPSLCVISLMLLLLDALY